MNSTLIGAIGAMTVIASVLVKFIGLPDQFRKNFNRKSTKELSTAFIVISIIAYSLWTTYGILQKDWVVVLGQGVGVLTTGAIAYQIWIYRGNKE